MSFLRRVDGEFPELHDIRRSAVCLNKPSAFEHARPFETNFENGCYPCAACGPSLLRLVATRGRLDTSATGIIPPALAST